VAQNTVRKMMNAAEGKAVDAVVARRTNRWRPRRDWPLPNMMPKPTNQKTMVPSRFHEVLHDVFRRFGAREPRFHHREARLHKEHQCRAKQHPNRVDCRQHTTHSFSDKK
jgi:hypothetical protein